MIRRAQKPRKFRFGKASGEAGWMAVEAPRLGRQGGYLTVLGEVRPTKDGWIAKVGDEQLPGVFALASAAASVLWNRHAETLAPLGPMALSKRMNDRSSAEQANSEWAKLVQQVGISHSDGARICRVDPRSARRWLKSYASAVSPGGIRSASPLAIATMKELADEDARAKRLAAAGEPPLRPLLAERLRSAWEWEMARRGTPVEIEPLNPAMSPRLMSDQAQLRAVKAAATKKALVTGDESSKRTTALERPRAAGKGPAPSA